MGKRQRKPHGHVGPTDRRIGDSGVESGDADELDSADHTNKPSKKTPWGYGRETHPENPARTTKTMTNAIHVQVTGGRKVLTKNIPTIAIPTLKRQAYNHGRSGWFPMDQRPASHPAVIWMGKSISAATAKSSFGRPFSTSLSEVAASCACQAIFATKWRAKSFWMSVCGIKRQKRMRRGMYIRFSLHIFHMP